MAIVHGICDSYKQEILRGIHTDTDTYMIALYDATATLDNTTTVYTTVGEVTGTGYTAGGQALTGFSVTLSGSTAILDFTTDPVWPSATITARGALIYNASKGNRAVMVIDFGADQTSTNGNFTVQFPVPDAVNGLIRIA